MENKIHQLQKWFIIFFSWFTFPFLIFFTDWKRNDVLFDVLWNNRKICNLKIGKPWQTIDGGSCENRFFFYPFVSLSPIGRKILTFFLITEEKQQAEVALGKSPKDKGSSQAIVLLIENLMRKITSGDLLRFTSSPNLVVHQVCQRLSLKSFSSYRLFIEKTKICSWSNI